jgi:ankyrin repeat protein
VVQVLLEYGADVSGEDGTGRTPLHEAAKRGHAEVTLPARLLLAHGADVSARDHAGFTPLHYASSRDNETVVQMLLDKVNPKP